MFIMHCTSSTKTVNTQQAKSDQYIQKHQTETTEDMHPFGLKQLDAS
jgi:ribosomal protein S6